MIETGSFLSVHSDGVQKKHMFLGQLVNNSIGLGRRTTPKDKVDVVRTIIYSWRLVTRDVLNAAAILHHGHGDLSPDTICRFVEQHICLLNRNSSSLPTSHDLVSPLASRPVRASGPSKLFETTLSQVDLSCAVSGT